jgi:plastocyanin
VPKRAKTVVATLISLGAALILAGALSGPAQADTAVSISNSGCAGGSAFCFVPSDATVSNGTTVTWTNQSGAPHTVTRCTPSACNGTDGGTGTDAGFTTGSIGANNGATFSHAFNGGGTYNYYCQIHGFAVMHGTVTVQSAATTTTQSSTSPSSTPPATTAPSPAASPSPPARAVAGNVTFTG